jgi:hypothetical protein
MNIVRSTEQKKERKICSKHQKSIKEEKKKMFYGNNNAFVLNKFQQHQQNANDVVLYLRVTR